MHPATEALCHVPKPLTWTDEKNTLFIDACREMANFHSQNNASVAHLYQRKKFHPDSLKSLADIASLPALNVHGMKYHLLCSRPEEKAILRLTSSGTGGQKTQAWMDQESLDRAQAMLDTLWAEEELVSSTPTHYVMFVYDPEQAQDLGIAFSARNRQRFAPVKSSTYAIRKNAAGDWNFEKERIVAHLRELARGNDPVRLIGITAFLYELILELENSGSVQLPAGSFVFTTGGWKAAESKKVSRAEFRARAAKMLGIQQSQMRDGYGMAEHGAPYWECSSHRLHVPVYARVLIRNPITLEPLPNGEDGIVQLITPFNSMMPTLAVMTTDLGVIHADACPCGKNSPTFQILGRGGLAKHKGCAIHAAEIVKRSTTS